MTTKSEKAVSLFNSGYNCAQSVLATFSEQYGMCQESALKIASGLGGGIRCGEVCGAASGAVLVIGLKCGQYIADDTITKSKCNEESALFMKRFYDKNSTVVCREILGCDISTQQGMEHAKSKNLFTTTCVETVAAAVEILEEMGY